MLFRSLARIEAICALQALFIRWPALKLVVEPSQVHWRRRPGIRMIAELPVVAGGISRKAITQEMPEG